MSVVSHFDDVAAGKLVKIARLFSSDLLGERAAAANAAHRMVAGLGLDWSDVIRPIRPAPRPHAPADDWHDDLRLALRFQRDLNAWEARFIANMRGRSSATPKQRRTLAEIAAHLRARGRT